MQLQFRPFYIEDRREEVATAPVSHDYDFVDRLESLVAEQAAVPADQAEVIERQAARIAELEEPLRRRAKNRSLSPRPM